MEICTRLLNPEPGKFEGETCVTILAYHLIGLGVVEDCGADGHSENCMIIAMPIPRADVATIYRDNPEWTMYEPCEACLSEMETETMPLHSWEDDQGFVGSEYVATE